VAAWEVRTKLGRRCISNVVDGLVAQNFMQRVVWMVSQVVYYCSVDGFTSCVVLQCGLETWGFHFGRTWGFQQT
jgi:hypothetical protein